MKLKVSKEKILNSLQKVQSVVASRTTIPILANVLIKAEKDRLHFTATDLDVSVIAGCEAQVSKPGATTLPARRIFSIFKELPGPDIELEVDDKNQASIRSGSSFFKLVGAAEDEFPPLPKLDAAKTYTIGQGVFREMVRCTSYAASRDESRPMLNGVLLSFKGGKLSGVKLAYNGLAPSPCRAPQLEAVLEGQFPADVKAADLDAAIANSFTARDGLRATWAYRALVARNLVLEFIEEQTKEVA